MKRFGEKRRRFLLLRQFNLEVCRHTNLIGFVDVRFWRVWKRMWGKRLTTFQCYMCVIFELSISCCFRIPKVASPKTKSTFLTRKHGLSIYCWTWNFQTYVPATVWSRLPYILLFCGILAIPKCFSVSKVAIIVEWKQKGLQACKSKMSFCVLEFRPKIFVHALVLWASSSRLICILYEAKLFS
jgi:hypothetical protein